MIVASIDIGTNTVLLLIAEVNHDKTLSTILNEYRIPRIGKGLLPGNPIDTNKIQTLIKVLREYEVLTKKYNCEKVLVTATNALRISSNGREITKIIREQFGWNVNIVSGEEEAYLSYLGAISDLTNKGKVIVIDIGGGSTELIYGNRNEIIYKNSFQIGVVSGTGQFLKNDPPTFTQMENFEKYLENVFKELGTTKYAPDVVIALAGTPTTLACMDLNIEEYNEELVEGHNLTFDKIYQIKKHIKKLSSIEILNSYKSVAKGREDLILAGGIILLKIMELINLDYIRVSTKGIRYGTIIKEFVLYM